MYKQAIKALLIILFIGLIAISAHAQVPPELPEPPRQAEQENDESEGRRLFVLGITEFELENFEEAIELLLQAREKLGGSSGLDFAISDAYLETDDLVNAAYYGKKAVEQAPDNKWYRLKLAEIYRKSGRNQATIDELEAILEYHPADIEVLYNLAQVQTMHGKLLDANRTYDRIIQLSGPDIQVYFQKFRNFRTLGQRDSAIVQLENMLDIEPDNIGALQTLSQFYLEDDDVENARKALERALEINPNDEETIIAVADLLIQEEKWEEASEMLSVIVRNPGVSAIAKVELGQYMLNRYTRNPASEALKKATGDLVRLIIESESESGYSHALAAEYYSYIDDEEGLMAALIETNRLLPENEPAWRQRIQMLLMDDKFDEAVEVGKQADEAIPDDAFVLFLVGNAYLLKNESDKAIEWLERASAAPSQRQFRSTIYTVLGDSYAQKKVWESADEAYEMALRLNSANDVALNNYAYYLSTRIERLDEALEMAQKAVKAQPDNAAYLDTIGWIYFKMGNYDQALEYIHASIDTGEASAVVHEHLGDVYEKMGDMENARKWWRKALNKDDSKEHLIEKLSDN